MESSPNPLTSPPLSILPIPDEARLKPTLLVVDDEEGPRMSLKVIFADAYNVLLADSGKAAIELAQANKIDVAVLDIRMAEMSGIEVLERLKYIDPTIEVVMMTAYAETETVRQALRLRACDYIHKPFDVTTIRRSVSTALERRSLNGEVLQNTEKLGALQKELEQQKMDEEMARTRGEIYASIIHDINSPLTIISGLIQIINHRIGGETKVEGEELEQVKDRLKRITRQVTNCIEISRRYLGFLRQSPSESAKVWINQILADVGELLRVHPAAKSNELVIVPLAQDVTGLVNGTDMIQILLNLALNAMQCSSNAHRVEIRCELKQEAVSLDGIQDGAEDRFINRDGFANAAPLLAVSVADNGPGMPSEVLGKIFQPYFTTKGKSNGTGLGLCIVHRLLKECRGGLHVHTLAGQGTSFTVYLQARV
ncbi:MAG: Response regulator receiver sensor signal transduction histidine kinase [Verrucomicrobiales bacterium]|nr:Response regulator receiver sensor signal transduction histidine kinase [Verrucomicrobiales bacterium]